MAEIRRIVVLQQQDDVLRAVRSNNSGSIASSLTATLGRVRGAQLVEENVAVPVASVADASADRDEKSQVMVSMVFEDEEAIARLKRDRSNEFVASFANPKIQPVETVGCADDAEGTSKTVAARFRRASLHASGLDGSGVDLVIVDTGIKRDGAKNLVTNLTGAWHPNRSDYVAGSARPERGSSGTHGTMCAWNAQRFAPKAAVYDYALLDTSGSWQSFLFDAVKAYLQLISLRATNGRPMVVNNSWAMYDPASEDLPSTDPGNYSANPAHPFNRVVRRLIAAGADVVFAAGNCGQDCPDGRCGTSTGRGKSIHGAAGLGDVLTIGGVSVGDKRVGYSSQGPSSITLAKPDLCAYTHFAGSEVYATDSGTSTSAPIVAGLIAALRSKVPTLSPAELAAVLRRTAKDLGSTGFDHDHGYGLVNVVAAAKLLGVKVKKPPQT